MDLTLENKKIIDDMSYRDLLIGWRFSPSSGGKSGGNPLLQGETGEYWRKRMAEIKPDNHVEISKEIGWGQ